MTFQINQKDLKIKKNEILINKLVFTAETLYEYSSVYYIVKRNTRHYYGYEFNTIKNKINYHNLYYDWNSFLSINEISTVKNNEMILLENLSVKMYGDFNEKEKVDYIELPLNMLDKKNEKRYIYYKNNDINHINDLHITSFNELNYIDNEFKLDKILVIFNFISKIKLISLLKDWNKMDERNFNMYKSLYEDLSLFYKINKLTLTNTTTHNFIMDFMNSPTMEKYYEDFICENNNINPLYIIKS
jgi:hypothetical protein